VTFGYRIPMAFPNRPDHYDRKSVSYPLVMEQYLRAANPDRDIEVVNLAVPGYTSHQGLAWLRSEIETLEPDLVVACFGWNDINLRAGTDREMMQTDWYNVALRRTALASQAISHIVKWRRETKKSKPSAHRDAVLRVPIEDYVGNFRQIARTAQEYGASVVILGPVYRGFEENPKEWERMTLQRDALRGAMQEAGIPYLEIPELTEHNHADNLMLFGEPVHPNDPGHRLMAVHLLRFLASQDMLWDLTVPKLPPG
jgi:lysophospholipase L1-like esterase